MRVRATEDAVVRLLKAGHPLPSKITHRREDVRLPVFQAIEPVSVKDFGVDAQTRIVIARARKEVWFVDIKRRNLPVTKDDAESFLGLLKLIRDQHQSQTVTGWMVTTSDLEPDAQHLLHDADCLYTSRALKR